jgi:DNA-binding transcriptional MocR family regulator
LAEVAKAKPKPGTDRAKLIYRALRHAIIEQALEPGAKLPEDTIGERFGASRTIVRSALGRLASEGLVDLRRNRGGLHDPRKTGLGKRNGPVMRATEPILARRPETLEPHSNDMFCSVLLPVAAVPIHRNNSWRLINQQIALGTDASTEGPLGALTCPRNQS